MPKVWGGYEKAEMSRRKRKQPEKKPPVNATAWCLLHERMMNDVYIRRRGCVMRRCKHLNWLETSQKKGGKTNGNSI